MNRKRIILASLLGVLAACLLYAYVATPRLEKAPPRAVRQTVRADVKSKADTPAKGMPDRINFDFMTVDTQEFPGAKRDIFQFGGRPQVVRETPTVVAPPVIEEVVAPEPEMLVPIAVINNALSQFTFLGFLEKAGEKTVFLSSDGTLFLVKSGERFGSDQEFLVTDIGDKLLKVRHPGRAELVEIPLIEQKKLSASASSPAPVRPTVVEPNPSRARAFAPQQRMLRPAAPQEIETPFTEVNEEINPEEKQEAEVPAEGDVLEGESNGSN